MSAASQVRGALGLALSAGVSLLSLLLLASCSAVSPEVGPIATTTSDGGCAPADVQGGVSFARDLRPIMNRFPDDPAGSGCAKCHYANAANPIGISIGGLDMTTLGSLRKGGRNSGANVVLAGNPEGSAIVQKLRGTYFIGARMPKNGPYLTDAETKLFADWIQQGAKGSDCE